METTGSDSMRNSAGGDLLPVFASITYFILLAHTGTIDYRGTTIVPLVELPSVAQVFQQGLDFIKRVVPPFFAQVCEHWLNVVKRVDLLPWMRIAFLARYPRSRMPLPDVTLQGT